MLGYNFHFNLIETKLTVNTLLWNAKINSIFNSKPQWISKIIFQVHGKISSKMRGDQDSMSEKIIFRTPEVPRRRRVELCDPGGDILFSGHENIGDHFISPGVLRRPKSAMDFSERPHNHASRTSEGYRWELLWQFVFCFYSTGGREDPRDSSLPHFVELDSFIFYSQTQENFFNFWVKLNFEVEAATKNHLSIHFE